MSIYTRSSNVRKFTGPESIKGSYYDYILILNNNGNGLVTYYGFNEFYKTVVIHKIFRKDFLHYYSDIEHYDCNILIKMLFNNEISEE